MSIEKTAYYKAFCEKMEFKDDHSIKEYVALAPKFNYGILAYSDFSKKYSSQGWGARKIAAIPACLWAGVVKTTFYLFAAIINGTFHAAKRNTKPLKKWIFSAVRSLEESFGRFISLFHDKYGSYHIQGAKLHKELYGDFEFRDFFPSLVKFRKHGVSYDRRASLINLEDFKAKSLIVREKLITVLGLSNAITKLKTEKKVDFFQFLGKTDKAKLEGLTLEDIVIPFEKSRLKYALMEDKKFKALKLKDVASGTTSNQRFYIAKWMRKLADKTKTYVYKAREDCSEYSIERLAQLTPESIARGKDAFPLLAYRFFSNEQVATLKLADLDSKKNEALFSGLNKDGITNRLAQYSIDDVLAALYTKKITSKEILVALSPDQLRKLDISKLDHSQIDGIFQPICIESSRKPGVKGLMAMAAASMMKNSLINKEAETRFAFLPADKVNEALKKGLISHRDYLRILSDEHLKNLEVSQLKKETISRLLDMGRRNKRRFAHIPDQEIKNAIDSGNLSVESAKDLGMCISEQQLKVIDFSTIDKTFIAKMFPSYTLKRKLQSGSVLSIWHDLNKKRTRKNFSRMSPKQRKILRDKVSDDNKALLDQLEVK